jgi:hypothetical protein
MKMAKSSTRKKSNNLAIPKEGVELMNSFTDYVKAWTEREFKTLHEIRDTSICVPTSDGYRIGLYRLRVHKNKTCSVYDRNENFVHTFETKVSAVIYTIYNIKHRFTLADELLSLDREINRNYTDTLVLKRGIEYARKHHDYVSMDIKQARLQEAELLLTKSKDKVSTMLATAKARKVWQ